jgi:hypothetical protein
MDEALRLTKQTIETRSARFRDLVVLVVGLAAACLVCTLVLRSWEPLLGLLLLVPLAGVFVWRDASLVNDWRRGIAELWIHDRLELEIFSTAVRGIPIFPSGMLGGMLAILPTKERGVGTAAFSRAMREALAGALELIGRCQRDQTALSTLAYTIGLTSLALALLRHSWMPLAGLLLLVPIRSLGFRIAVLRFRPWWRRVRELLPRECERSAFIEAAGRLDWEPIPAATKRRLLRSCGSAP